MPEEVNFLFDNQLIAAVEQLIRDSKNKLSLISPFIDLDPRIKDALNEKINLPDFELFVLFGKNENNYYKSIKRDSIEFLKQFPNIEIRYNERLHAKFYMNDFSYIMTSLNLYNYSLANNIEVGIKGEYASKGILKKTLDLTESIIGQGIDSVKHDVLGIDKGTDVIEKFYTIFENSDLKFKTRPIFFERSGVQSLISKKRIEKIEVVVNTLDNVTVNENKAELTESIKTTITTTTQTVITEERCLSATQLAKNLKIQARDIIILMERKGYVKNDQITEAGRTKGLVIKKYMGNEYIAYPENLIDLNELRN